jgi:hypothetical protein
MKQSMSERGFPLTKAHYLPDPKEPIDRWFQPSNASNARTTAEIVRQMVTTRPSILIDPFAGGGSTAVAARILRLPFFGIEINPILACVTLAKSQGQLRQAQFLASAAKEHGPQHLDQTLAYLRALCQPADVPAASALAVLSALRTLHNSDMRADEVVGDLTLYDLNETPDGRAICGDASEADSWEALELPACDAVIYTSPPFGLTPSRITIPAHLERSARQVLQEAHCATDSVTEARRTKYADITIAMLRMAIEHVSRGSIIIEHEPDDEGMDSTSMVVERASAELLGRIHNPQLINCGKFSRRGTLTLITFDLE